MLCFPLNIKINVKNDCGEKTAVKKASDHNDVDMDFVMQLCNSALQSSHVHLLSIASYREIAIKLYKINMKNRVSITFN